MSNKWIIICPNPNVSSALTFSWCFPRYILWSWTNSDAGLMPPRVHNALRSYPKCCPTFSQNVARSWQALVVHGLRAAFYGRVTGNWQALVFADKARNVHEGLVCILCFLKQYSFSILYLSLRSTPQHKQSSPISHMRNTPQHIHHELRAESFDLALQAFSESTWQRIAWDFFEMIYCYHFDFKLRTS